MLGSRCGWCAQGGISKAARSFLATLRRYLSLVHSFIPCTPGRMATTVQMVRTQVDDRKHTNLQSLQSSSFAQGILKQKSWLYWFVLLRLMCCTWCFPGAFGTGRLVTASPVIVLELMPENVFTSLNTLETAKLQEQDLPFPDSSRGSPISKSDPSQIKWGNPPNNYDGYQALVPSGLRNKHTLSTRSYTQCVTHSGVLWVLMIFAVLFTNRQAKLRYEEHKRWPLSKSGL